MTEWQDEDHNFASDCVDSMKDEDVEEEHSL
jgi:hypothetical protein